MVPMKQDDKPVAAVIGDLIRSRHAADRAALHGQFAAVLEEANAVLAPVVPLRITAGDEYQGCFATVGAALHATLWVQLHLAAGVRHGVGWGTVAVLDDSPRVEDGPAWWVARAAIDEAEGEAARAGTRLRRTAYRRADDTDGPDPDTVNAALMCRDQMVGSLSERSLRLLRGAVDGHSQAALAEQEAISASAVSQRMRNDGLGVILAADELLKGVR